MKLVSIPANPVPDDVTVAALKTPDGVNLRYARWAPPPGRKGTVCVFPGRSEYIEKYFETVRDLRARRDAKTWERAMAALDAAARRCADGEIGGLMPAMIEASDADATTGELMGALKKHLGWGSPY